MMCTGLPNLVSVFGYINASWTLRADIVSRWFCRLLNHMRDRGATVVTPTPDPAMAGEAGRSWIEGFSAGYMQRVMHRFPRQGAREPWVNSQDYGRWIWMSRRCATTAHATSGVRASLSAP
jgi:monooxygenase